MNGIFKDFSPLQKIFSPYGEHGQGNIQPYNLEESGYISMGIVLKNTL